LVKRFGGAAYKPAMCQAAGNRLAAARVRFHDATQSDFL
jgi:hypothetical protein